MFRDISRDSRFRGIDLSGTTRTPVFHWLRKTAFPEPGREGREDMKGVSKIFPRHRSWRKFPQNALKPSLPSLDSTDEEDLGVSSRTEP